MDNNLILTDAQGTPADYGDTVQFILDKLGGGQLGPELAPGVDSLDGWIISNAPGAGSVTVEPGGLRFSSNGNGILALRSGDLDFYKLYSVTLDIAEVSGDLRLENDAAGASTPIIEGKATYFIRRKEEFYFRNGSGTAFGEGLIKSVSVREIKGAYVTQPSSSLKPARGRVPVVGRRNLLVDSEAFDTSWTNNACIITEGQSGPGIGELRAFKVVADSTTGGHRIVKGTSSSITAVAGTQITGSFCVKPAEIRGVTLGIFNGLTFNFQTVVFDLDARSAIPGGTATGTVEALLDGWFRLTITATFDADVTLTNCNLYLYPHDGDILNYTGDDVSGVYATAGQINVGDTATPYQRVRSDLDVYEEGQQHIEYLRFDRIDDKVLQTFPNGLNGDLIVCGTEGSWIDEGVSVAAGGDLEIGPTDLPNTPGAFQALGDIVGWLPIDRTLTAEERTRVIEYYKGRGAKGKLVPSGVELFPQPSFDSTDGLTLDPTWTVASGKATADGTKGFIKAENSGLIVGKPYLCSVEIVERTSGDIYLPYDGAGGNNLARANVGTYTRVLVPTNDAGAIFIYSRDFVGSIDNVSVQELIPEEDLA